MGTHLCDEVVHQQAVGAKDAAGIGDGLGETADDEKPICRQFARIFSRWIVMWRKRARAHLDEAGVRLRLEAAQCLFLSRRKESRYGNHAAPRLFNYFINCRRMFLQRFLSGEAHREKER